MSIVKLDLIFHITIYSHFIKITHITAQGRHLLDHFLAINVHKAFKPQNPYKPYYKAYRTNAYNAPPPVPDKIYGLATKDADEYRFHIGQLKLFQEFMERRGIDSSLYSISKESVHPLKELKTKIKEGWTLRDRQPDVVEFLLSDINDDHNSRLVTLNTGEGKTVIAAWATKQRNYRTAYIILPQYIERTVKAIKDITTATDKDIVVVQGSDSIRGLIELGKTNKYEHDFLVVSMKTWTNYIDSYLKDRKYCIGDEYGCSPEEVISLLGIGTVVFDEIHQHMHGVYRTFCFLNTDKVIGLSATFLSNDPFIDKIQHTMFPREIRFRPTEMKKYIKNYAISYSISTESMSKIRTTERGNTSYSQSAFEKSILKYASLKYQYMKLVDEVFTNGFLNTYKPGYKCAIFVRSIAMAETIVEFLKGKYSHLDIRRFVEDDPYENLMDSTVRVTTQQSGGTAHDIANLMTTITLDNIGSPVSTLQCFGRLREPKEGTPLYFSVYSESIPKHVQYARNRKELLEPKCISYKEFKSNVMI